MRSEPTKKDIDTLKETLQRERERGLELSHEVDWLRKLLATKQSVIDLQKDLIEALKARLEINQRGPR